MILGAASLAAPGIASAYTEPATVSANSSTIADALAVYGEDGTGITCNATCSSLASRLTAVSPTANNGAGAAVLTEAEQVTEDAGAGFAWDAVPVIALGTATFIGGYEIGSKIAQWIGISTPGYTATGDLIYSRCFQLASCAWTPVRAGHTYTDSAGDVFTAPHDGYWLSTTFFGGGYTPFPDCPGASGGVPPGASFFWDPSTVGTGECGAGNRTSLIFLPRAKAQTTAPQTYTGGSGQPVTGSVVTDQGASKSQTQVETSVGNQLSQTSGGSYINIETWLDNQLGGPSLDPTVPSATIPASCQLGSQVSTCSADLATAGFTNVTVTTLTDTTLDPQYGPNAVTKISPASGTQAQTNTAVKVEANPSDAPTTATGAPPSGPTMPGITVPTAPTPCNVFPFGIPCWLANQLGQFSAAPVAPSWTIGLPPVFGGNTLTVNLDHPFGVDLSSMMAIARVVLLVLSFIGLVMWLGGMALGGSTGGGGSAEAEE